MNVSRFHKGILIHRINLYDFPGLILAIGMPVLVLLAFPATRSFFLACFAAGILGSIIRCYRLR